MLRQSSNAVGSRREVFNKAIPSCDPQIRPLPSARCASVVVHGIGELQAGAEAHYRTLFDPLNKGNATKRTLKKSDIVLNKGQRVLIPKKTTNVSVVVPESQSGSLSANSGISWLVFPILLVGISSVAWTALSGHFLGTKLLAESLESDELKDPAQASLPNSAPKLMKTVTGKTLVPASTNGAKPRTITTTVPALTSAGAGAASRLALDGTGAGVASGPAMTSAGAGAASRLALDGTGAGVASGPAMASAGAVAASRLGLDIPSSSYSSSSSSTASSSRSSTAAAGVGDGSSTEPPSGRGSSRAQAIIGKVNDILSVLDNTPTHMPKPISLPPALGGGSGAPANSSASLSLPRGAVDINEFNSYSGGSSSASIGTSSTTTSTTSTTPPSTTTSAVPSFQQWGESSAGASSSSGGGGSGGGGGGFTANPFPPLSPFGLQAQAAAAAAPPPPPRPVLERPTDNARLRLREQMDAPVWMEREEALPVKVDGPDKEMSVQALKNGLMDVLYGTSRGVTASSEQHGIIEEFVTSLEHINPHAVATDAVDVLSGRWKLVYTSNTQTLMLLNALDSIPLVDVGDVYQVVDGKTLTAHNKIDLAVPVMMSLHAESAFEVRTGKSFKVSFHKVGLDTYLQTPNLLANIEIPENINILGNVIDLSPLKSLIVDPVNAGIDTAKGLLQQAVSPRFEIEPNAMTSLWMLTTYLDDTLRISRDDSGRVFVMLKDIGMDELAGGH